MIRKAIFLILGIALVCPLIYAQSSGFDHIVFSLHHSKRIPDNKLRIELINQGSKTVVRVQSEPMEGHLDVWKQSRLDTTFNITAEVFEKVVNSISEINYYDIAAELTVMGKDGNSCSIEYGKLEDYSIIYKIWSPEYNTKKRKLQDYLHSCETIIKAAGLDPKRIL